MAFGGCDLPEGSGRGSRARRGETGSPRGEAVVIGCEDKKPKTKSRLLTRGSFLESLPVAKLGLKGVLSDPLRAFWFVRGLPFPIKIHGT